MFAKILSASLRGMEASLAEVEADAGKGIPAFYVTGWVSAETKEAQFRVLNALKNTGMELKPQKITVNITPASCRKEGTAFDLPIAVAVLCASGIFDYRLLSDTAFIGEIGLDGELKKLKGVLPMALALREQGVRRLIVPAANGREAALSSVPEVYGCGSLREVLELVHAFRQLQSGRETKKREAEAYLKQLLFERDAGISGAAPSEQPDFAEVRGQHYLKRAAEIAVAGRHNILFSGPAGTGKTMIARRMAGIMPPLTERERMEITKIYSICGLLPEGSPLIAGRPFRAPSQGISQSAFTGGGPAVLPGELSLASGGILFMDELPLFSRPVLESMRQPLEEKSITVTRVRGSFSYPADFMLVAAMNNCACGFYPDRNRCRCSPAQIHAYIGRLSRPLLERIDICAEAAPLRYEDLTGTDRNRKPEESSAAIRERVEAARLRQAERYGKDGITCNSRLSGAQIEKYCALGAAERRFMKDVFTSRGLSGRTYHKILKLARSIADLEQREEIRVEDLAEAVSFRGLEDKLFGGKR